MRTRAKVVCTLGPASSDTGTITALARAGMSVARLNASHGSPSDRRDLIERVREAERRLDRPIAVLHDMAGPEVRTADIAGTVSLETGTTVVFEPGTEASRDRIGLSAAIDRVDPGDRVLLDDGRIETEVTAVDGECVEASVRSGGALSGRTGVNVPGVDLGLPTVTEADRRELDLAAEVDVEFVAASFVRSASDIYEVEAELEQRNADIPIVAKIERADAVENVAEIIAAADGVMVARGDLGVECPLEDVPLIQKRIIHRAQTAGVPVITATEMLDSMIHERRPTRAEVSDVANAVLDGTDAVMLSGETAIGDHPVEVVETMMRVVEDVESSDEYTEALENRVPAAENTRAGALARSARYLARDLDASAVVVASESGYTARKAAKYRPPIPIVAATTESDVRRRLALSWGIIPARADAAAGSVDAVIQNAVQSALDADVARSGDTVVVLSGMMTEYDDLDTANMLKVHVASPRVASGRSVVSGFATGPVYPVTDGDLSDLPEGAILSVPEAFDGEFRGDLSRIGGIVDAHPSITGYPAIVARELDVPMISHAHCSVEAGREITLDAERGVVYADPLGSDNHHADDGQ